MSMGFFNASSMDNTGDYRAGTLHALPNGFGGPGLFVRIYSAKDDVHARLSLEDAKGLRDAITALIEDHEPARLVEGDRVRIAAASYHWFEDGLLGTVTEDEQVGTSVSIRGDRLASNGSEIQVVKPEHLTKVEDEGEDEPEAGDALADWERELLEADAAQQEPTKTQSIPDGTPVMIVNSGAEDGMIRHYLDVGTRGKITGWEDFSDVEDVDYEEAYLIEGVSANVSGGSLGQWLTTESFRTLTLGEALKKMRDDLAEIFPARYVTGVKDPAVEGWTEALREASALWQIPEHEIEEPVDEDDEDEVEETFAPGDRVKVVDGSAYSGDAAGTGGTGEVVERSGERRGDWQVSLDAGNTSPGQTLGYFEHEIEKVEEEARPCSICDGPCRYKMPVYF